MKGRTTFLISIVATMAVLFAGCATEDKVANDIRNATKTVDPYDYNYDFSDMKDKTNLGRGNGEGYWGYTTNDDRVDNNKNQIKNQVRNTTNRITNNVRQTADKVNNKLEQVPKTRATGGRISPNTATDSQYKTPYLNGNSTVNDNRYKTPYLNGNSTANDNRYKTPYLYGSSTEGDYIVNPVVLGN